jgi:uncharacterized repeat protein (TIGR01451 family)
MSRTSGGVVFIGRGPRVFKAIFAFGLVVGLVAMGTARASTPPTGSVTVPSTINQTVTDTWTGSIPAGANATSDCSGFPDPVLDHHLIQVNVPAGVYSTLNASFTFTIDWTPVSGDETTNDEILTVIDPNGNEIASSDGGSTTETVAANNLAAGQYDVIACGFNNVAPTGQPYNGRLIVTTRAPESTLPSAPAQGLQFSAAVPADAQRDESEPLMETDKAGNIYTCGPTGFSQGADYAQVSTDGGDQFHLLGDPPRGQQSAAGGGDCGIATSPVKNSQGNYQYGYAGLGALSGFATSTSPNNGHSIATFGADLQGGVTNQGVGADRQWLTFLNDDHTVLMSYNQTEPHNTVVIKSTDGGLTYDVSNAAVGAPNTRFPGPMHYDPVNNVAYFAWDRGATGGGDSINLSISRDGGVTWTDCRATVAPANANGFVVADSDSAGNIYVAYGEQSSFHTYLVALSAANVTKCDNPVIADGENPTNNPGFSVPVQVDRDAVRTTVFPWLVASGQPGRVAVAFYGTESDGDANSGNFKASWDVYVNQSLNALSTDPTNPPTFSQVKATTHPFHYDSICLSGLACDLAVPAGDRTLADFFAIDLNPVTQKLSVVFNRTNKKPDETLGHVATPMVTTQTAGPKNGGGTFGTTPPQPLVRTSSSDPTGDALSSYSTLAPLTPPPTPATTNEPAADFTSVSVGPEINLSTGTPISPGGFTVTMKVADLSTTSLATTAARTQSSSLLWVFRFTNGYQDAGASARWNAGGFTFGFNDYTLGSTPCESGSTPQSEKCVIFPGGTPIQGDVNQTTGTIRLSVPLSLLRGLSGPTGAGQRPVEVAASAGTRFYDAEALSLGNASADQNAQSFLYPLDNTPAMDFLVPSPDLAIGGTDTPDPVYTGDDLTYTLTALNGGVGNATGVSLTDMLPTGVVFESATPSQGTCSQSSGTVTCSLGTLAGAATATVAITVAPTSGATSYTNQASVTANQPDPNLANNAISQTTAAVGAACTITGTPGVDSITGSTGNDRICGIGGNDTISGGLGNDVIVGGAGNDAISGNDGDDNIIPGLGGDSVNGGAGSDTVNYIDIMSSYGVGGVNVNLSTNSVTGGAGSDTLAAGTVENAAGSPQNDTLTGNASVNSLFGFDGSDTMTAGAGND